MAKTKRRAVPATEKNAAQPRTQAAPAQENDQAAVSYFIPLVKADTEKQEVTGVVLQPDVVDAHGDIIPEAVIAKAAHNFLASYNESTKLGEQHTVFKNQFELYESYTMPVDVVLDGKEIKKGTWMMVAKVKDSEVWQKVKDGEITGFSIGGKAKVRQVQQEESD